MDTIRKLVPLLQTLADDRPLGDLLAGVIAYAEARAPGMRMSVLLADTAAGVLRHGAAPALPEAYCRAIDGLPYGEGVGSCGTAAARRELVIVADIASSPLWADFRELAAQHGLAACWSIPILSDHHELLGTCAMYYDVPRTPSAVEIQFISGLGALAALVIHRHREHAARLRNEGRFRFLASRFPDAIIEHAGGSIRYLNDSAVQLLGLETATAAIGLTLGDVLEPQTVRRLLGLRRGPSRIEWRPRGGRTVACEVSAVEVPVADEVSSLLVCRDVSAEVSLERQIAAAVTAEQERVSHDLHDGLGQHLTGIGFLVEALGKGPLQPAEGVRQELAKISRLVNQAIADSRRLARTLSPVIRDRQGLEEALRELVAHTRDIVGLAARLEVPVSGVPDLDAGVASQLYRIAQEALTNVARHAQARSVVVSLAHAAETLTLAIEDDGVGIDAALGVPAGLGLRIMQYRARVIDATLIVETRPGGGTRIACQLPLGATAAAIAR
ncbi:MAG: GAF domain-containing protein [Proteobacteria bacterium]|nr:GAF domain-containing protein [Pseudomonadota bacterium]